MHYLAFVEIHPDTELTAPGIEEAVATAMEPYIETWDEETGESSGFWDWYQIGGRWTGHFDGYDPMADPKNQEICWLCHGTGVRADPVGVKLGYDARVIEVGGFYDIEADHPRLGQIGWCNGCNGKGISVKFAGDSTPRLGDVATRLQVAEIEAPYTLVRLNGSVTHREVYVSDDSEYGGHFEAVAEHEEAWMTMRPEALIVAVDYHC